MTPFDQSEEEYILTPEEEQDAVSYAIKRAISKYMDMHLERGGRISDIEANISKIDWQKKINKEELLNRCNSNKQHGLWVIKKNEEEKQAKIKKDIELKSQYTAGFIFKIMSWISKNTYKKELILNDDTQKLIKVICFFISSDLRFETELGYSFNKGLLVRGPSGLGKTHLFKCVKDNELLPINIYSMIDISEEVQRSGYLDLPLTDGITYLDDVGSEEPVVKHYGTNINFFKNFIEKYYLDEKPFNRLIISTNNGSQQIEDKYGFRVRDRMKDMFNVIDVGGKSMRG